MRERETKADTVGVIGLGYVGIPSALAFSKRFNVIGIQRESEEGKRKVSMLMRGELPISGEPEMQKALDDALEMGTFRCTFDIREVARCDLVCVDIQTPVNQLPALTQLVKKIVPWMTKPGAIISIESTIPPGTTDRLMEEIEGARIVHAPERISPGRSMWNIWNYDRVIGGREEDVETASWYYLMTLERGTGRLIRTSAVEAEIIKTSENAIRDVQIAVSNNLAVYCEEFGANFFTVKRAIDSLGETKGGEEGVGRYLLEPGAGVGGHCLTKDTWLLEYNLKERNLPSIFQTGRMVNELMPVRMLEMTKGYPGKIGKVAVLGLAYKPDTDDIRESPSIWYVNKARAICGSEVSVHDPFCREGVVDGCTRDLEAALSGANVVSIFTAHTMYRESEMIQDAEILEEYCGSRPIMVVDGRNVIKMPEQFIDEGIIYRGIGRGDLNRL